MNQLDQLKKFTTVVADTGDFASIEKYSPQDATTNPTLIYKSASLNKYKPLLQEAISFAKKKALSYRETLEIAMDKLFINFGLEILKIIPGRVSIEVDARLSFDKKKSIKKARTLIDIFEKNNISRERILIKLAATWEGIMAAKELEKENISCNMTLLFSLVQAIACGKVNATLISPFVGRVLDWHIQNEKGDYLKEDPGVLSITEIFDYLKKYDYATEIMGASFRNKNQILSLAGCDFLTISPNLLEDLKTSKEIVTQKLSLDHSKTKDIKKIQIDEKSFRYLLNDNAMASDKLSEGIRKFTKDMIRLEDLIKKLM